jgi:hypothetical protein
VAKYVEGKEVTTVKVRGVYFKVLYVLLAIAALAMASGAPVNWGGG